ncbi:MAG: hypothetical protein IJH65_08895 [Methanobrevibacter sp.]|nr:hypothetical protein [Methanobrevibacter sp.]
MRRVVYMLMAIVLLATNILPSYAEEYSLRDQLNERQKYVYDLVQSVSDKDHSMLLVVQDKDNYFQIMDINGILDILSGNHLGEAFFGSDSYQQSYLNTVIADAITITEADYNLDEVQDADKFMDVVTTEAALLKDAPGYLDEISEITKTVSIAWEGEVYLLKVGFASDLYLNALALVADNSDDKNVSQSAKKAYVFAKSDEAQDQFLYWADTVTKKGVSALMDTIRSTSPLIIWNFAELGLDIISGDTVNNNLSELHATQFQSAVYNTFYTKLFEKGGNYLQNDYTDEELEDLHSLACLYLKTGYTGFSYNKWDNAKSCKKALKKILSLPFPTSHEQYSGPEITLSDYSCPGQLSVGDKYSFFGTVNSSEMLKRVSVEIISNENHYEYNSPELNDYTFQIHSIDNQIAVNQMPAAGYRYVVSATTDSGTHIVLDEPFKIIPEDGNMTINQYRIPGIIKEGTTFPVTGLVKSSSTLSYVKVEIITFDGQWVTGDESDSINDNQFDLSVLDANTRYDLLSTGRFRYRIIGRNESGTEVLVDQPILVIP